MDFILQSQARLAAAQERDREERVGFEKWSKDLHRRVVTLIDVQTSSLEIQSRRLDQYEKEQRTSERAAQERHEEFQEFLRELRSWRSWQQDFQTEALARLDRILQKLTERLN